MYVFHVCVSCQEILVLNIKLELRNLCPEIFRNAVNDEIKLSRMP